jgi:hypothetical protein
MSLPIKITEPGSSRSLNISSEVIMYSAPGIRSGRGFEAIAITMRLAFNMRSPTHPTSGIAPRCAPSLAIFLFQQ